MSSWLSDTLSSQRLQLGVTAIVSGGITVAAVLGLQEARRRYNVHDLKDSIPTFDTPHEVHRINGFGGAVPEATAESREDERNAALARRAQLGDYDEELIHEQLARNRIFLTDEGLAKLRSAFVIVVGVGGVGSHATAALARSGCGRLRLIDFDQVTLSSLNRHAVATLADVGTPKVDCLAKRLAAVAPWTQFDCVNALFTPDVASTQLAPWQPSQSATSTSSSRLSPHPHATTPQPPTYVIDAIDNIDYKVALLRYCHTHSIPVISSMGAGCKSDPTRVFIADISHSSDDPLSRATRRRLRLAGVAAGIPVVFSTEKTTSPGKATLQPIADAEVAQGGLGELGVLPAFRARVLPVLGTLPAVFGLCCANHIMLDIAGYPRDSDAPMRAKAREKMYDGVLAQLQGLEERLARAAGYDAVGLRIPVTADDVGYLVEEVFRGRSVVSGLGSRLALTRWRPARGDWVDLRTQGQKADRLAFDELVCMTKDEMARHEKLVLVGGKTPEEVWGADVAALVEKRLAEERVYREQR